MGAFSKHRITFFYLLTTFLFFCTGFLQTPGDSLDISIYDTYYVISKASIYFGIGMLFLIFTTIQALFILLKKPLLFGLSIIHLTLTLVGFVSLYYTCVQIQLQTAPKHFSDYSVMDDLSQIADTTNQLLTGLIFCVIFILASQLILVINIFLTLFRKSDKY